MNSRCLNNLNLEIMLHNFGKKSVLTDDINSYYLILEYLISYFIFLRKKKEAYFQ